MWSAMWSPLHQRDADRRHAGAPPNARWELFVEQECHKKRDEYHFNSEHRRSHGNITVLYRRKSEDLSEDVEQSDDGGLPEHGKRLPDSAQRPQRREE